MAQTRPQTRDERGTLLAVFSASYGLGSNKYAEMRTFIYGLRICREMNYLAIQIECDSHIVVDWFCKPNCMCWRLEDE